MGWIHSIWVNTSNEEEEHAILEHFKKTPNMVIDNHVYELRTSKGGMIAAHGIGINDRGIDDAKEALLLSKIGFKYYEILKTAPSFLYALVGVEVDGVLRLSELIEDPNWIIDLHGFVIKTSLYEQILTEELRQYKGVEVFREGYLWIPYQGELYQNW